MSRETNTGRRPGRPVGATEAGAPKVKLSFTVDADLYDELCKQANRSAFINKAIRQALGK